MPPAISLVTEFCHYGSLFDFLHSIEVNVSADKLISGAVGASSRSRTSTAQSAEIMRSPQVTGSRKVGSAGAGGGDDSTDSSVVKSPMINFADTTNNSSSNNNPLRGSTESTISKSQRNTDNSTNLRVSFQENFFDYSYDDRSSGGDENDNATSNILKFLDISAIDNVDAAAKLADALANEYNTNLSYRGSKSIHFYSKNNPAGNHQPPWSALSATYKISKELGTVNPTAGNTSVKMRNAAAVMLTREMGFGLGPSNSVPSENILKSPSSSKR